MKEFVYGCMKDSELVRILSCSEVAKKAEKPPEVCVVVVEEDRNTNEVVSSHLEESNLENNTTSDTLEHVEKNI